MSGRNRLAEAHNSPYYGEGQFCHPGPRLTSLSRPVPRLGGTRQMPVLALKTCGTRGRYLVLFGGCHPLNKTRYRSPVPQILGPVPAFARYRPREVPVEREMSAAAQDDRIGLRQTEDYCAPRRGGSGHPDYERVGVCEHRGSFLRSRVLCLCVMLCGMWSSAVSIDMIGVDYRSGRSIDLT